MKNQTKAPVSKKSIKRHQMAEAMTRAVVVHNRRQRFYGIVALVGLFMCGFMLGMDIQHKYAKPNVDNNVVNVEDVVPACSVIESRLLQNVYPDDVIDWNNPEHNVYIYTQLAEYGCPENKEKYEKMILREKQIADVFNVDKPKAERNCETIEKLLNRELADTDSLSFYNHIGNAKIYANLSERGCAENHQKYVDLAKQELEIARALQDDNLNNQDTIEVVETYKRIQMQQAAQEILDKAKRITNPAIDFIIELEKIIND